MKKLLTAALTAAALVLPAAVSYAAPAAKAASASHSDKPIPDKVQP